MKKMRGNQRKKLYIEKFLLYFLDTKKRVLLKPSKLIKAHIEKSLFIPLI